MRLIDENIRELIEGSVEEEGLTFVDMSLIRRKGGAVLRVYADRPGGGITVGECARLSRKLEMVIDNEGIFEGRYTLEVSSPGLDRPLKSEKEFGLRIGENIRLYYSGEDGSSHEIEGKLENVDSRTVSIVNEEKRFDIDLAKVIKGKIIL
jgi:ribosome maturation factor RimP